MEIIFSNNTNRKKSKNKVNDRTIEETIELAKSRQKEEKIRRDKQNMLDKDIINVLNDSDTRDFKFCHFVWSIGSSACIVLFFLLIILGFMQKIVLLTVVVLIMCLVAFITSKKYSRIEKYRIDYIKKYKPEYIKLSDLYPSFDYNEINH